jgi:hypothetical protein
MTEREPASTENCTFQYADGQLQPAGQGGTIDWAEGRDRLATSQQYWVATSGPGGRPQLRPVLGVWVDGAWCSTTNPGARKGRNIDARPATAVSVTTDGLDLVLEGTATWVTDEGALERIAEAYHDKYDWPVTLRGDGAYDAPYGAPSAGPPPYRPYAVVPSVVYGFGTDDSHYARSTRWRFA